MTNRADPTRTKTLRDAFVQEMNRRFAVLAREIRKAVDEEDVFGLRNNILAQQTPGPGQFAFPRSEDKIRAFMRWLQQQVDAGILEVGDMTQAGTAAESAWTNKYVYDSYKRGVIRSRYEMQKAGFTLGGSAQVSMMAPMHIDRVGLLFTRVFSELKGITAQMEQQISRVLAQGIADGDNPRLLSRKLTKVVTGKGDLSLTDTLGRHIPARRRAEIMARTEVIRAHHQATIQEYKNWGVEEVSVQAEWQTAGDARVCSECQSMQGSVFSLDEINNMIPLHPQCRCVALPYRKGDKTQSWGELKTEAAL